jgi:hypothetical protein
MFFLVKAKPFRPKELIPALNSINRDLKLGSVRTFQILGPYDLLVRAWLHPKTQPDFINRLKKIPHYRSHYDFVVESIESRWYLDNEDEAPPTPNMYELGQLNHARVDKIESGKDETGYERFKACRLAIRRPLPDGIVFFITVNFDDQPTGEGLDSIIQQMRGYIRSELKGFDRITIDRGTGFCRILIKGECRDFFEIGVLPSWIGETFHANQVVTETYLSHGRDHIAGDERISVSTLDWIGGFDLFAQSVIPELYPKSGKQLREDIERFLRNQRTDLTSGQRKFLHDFLLGVLGQQDAVLAQVLFLLFWELEGFLARAYEEFLGREKLDKNKLMKECKVEDPSRPSLMDLLQVCTKGVQSIGLDLDPKGLRSAGWNEWVDLRNFNTHKKGSPLELWQQIVETALRYWPQVLVLTKAMEERIPGKRFDGTFWP